MAIVCSNCDQAPPPGATPGGACPACGERLFELKQGDPLIGKVIDGRFEIVAPLGEGGMGMVYRAKQLSIGREVAIKVLDRRFERDEVMAKRFFREAKLASTLSHPNTVPIVDFGQSQDGQLYLVMELVRGPTLGRELARLGGPMPLARIIAIGTQLCDALETAHALSIVHRDLKLDNVMLEAAGRDHVRILDFGLARTLADPSSQMTATGLISGTPRYMPPEVGLTAAAPAPDQDMYAVGVILGELAVGRALWQAPTLEMLFFDKQRTEESISAVPAVLKPVIRALLSNDPALRPTAAQTRDLLRKIQVRDGERALADTAPPPNQVAVGTQQRVLPAAPSPLATSPDGRDPDGPDVGDALANPSLIDLDQRAESPRPSPPPVAPPAPVHDPDPIADDDPRFSGPERDAARIALEIHREDRRRARPPDPVTIVPLGKPSSIRTIAIGIVAVVGIATAVFFIYRSAVTTSHGGNEVPGGGVTILITADGDPQLRIDGKAAGRPPLTLKVPTGSTVLIEGDGVAPQRVTADRDRDVHLVRFPDRK